MFEEEQNKTPIKDGLFEEMANLPSAPSPRKFHRSKSNVIIAGVCSGLADYLKVDVSNLRLAALLTLLLGGWGIAAYFVAALLLPEESEPKILTKEETSLLQRQNLRTALGGVLILAGFHFALEYIGLRSSDRLFILPNGFIFPITALLFGIFILVKGSRYLIQTEVLYPQKYFRSRTNKMFLGVCGGLSEYMNIDSSALRVVFLIAALLTLGMFGLVYLLVAYATSLKLENELEKQ